MHSVEEMYQLTSITFCSCHHFLRGKWFVAHWSVHQHSADGQTNNKSETSREDAPRNTESAWETLWFMLVWAIHLGDCVRKTVIVSESTPQTFLKIIGSYESIIWGFCLCWVVKVRRGKTHFYCTAQHKSSYWSMCPLQTEGHKFHMFHTLFYTASQAVRERGSPLPDSI